MIKLSPEPSFKSEIEIQCELYNRLILIGLHCRMEVKQNCECRGARFDIVVYHKNRRPTIIEVKRRRSKRYKDNDNYHKYLKFDADIVMCCGESEIGLAVKKVSKLLNDEVKL